MSRKISIHALCEEGDQWLNQNNNSGKHFYPRPLRGGRPADKRDRLLDLWISIHALCEEGDGIPDTEKPVPQDFYPRPLRGGRLQFAVIKSWGKIFLSTPSARRATRKGAIYGKI